MTDLVYSPCVSLAVCANVATGILVFDSADVTISSNHVENTQSGIIVEGTGAALANDATITSNFVDGTLVYDGIDVCGSYDGTITGNIVTGSGQSGIHLDGGCTGVTSGRITASGNTINEACAGILNGATTSPNTIGTNTYYNDSYTLYGTTAVPQDTATCTEQLRQKYRGHEALAPRPGRTPHGPSGDSCDLTDEGLPAAFDGGR